MMAASQVMTVEIVLAMAKPPAEKIVPISGVSRVVPQVGQPAPSAISPVMIPAFSRFSALSFCFFFQRKTIKPINVLCKSTMKKVGSQSRKT